MKPKPSRKHDDDQDTKHETTLAEDEAKVFQDGDGSLFSDAATEDRTSASAVPPNGHAGAKWRFRKTVRQRKVARNRQMRRGGRALRSKKNRSVHTPAEAKSQFWTVGGKKVPKGYGNGKGGLFTQAPRFRSKAKYETSPHQAHADVIRQGLLLLKE